MKKVMNRAERRAHAALMEKLPEKLSPTPRENWPTRLHEEDLIAVWRNKKYLVQVFQEPNSVVRLSVNRVTVNSKGDWEDKIPWEDLQKIKADIGYADSYAVEVYPPEVDVVNVSNIRHLWVLPKPLNIGWKA